MTRMDRLVGLSLAVAALLLLSQSCSVTNEALGVAAINTRVLKSGPASSWVHLPTAEDRERMQAVCPQMETGLHIDTNSHHSPPISQHPHSTPPSTRIIGGEGTQLGVYPYAATFTNDPTSTRSRIAYCGGTLISRWHLITVAHCAKYGMTRGERVYILLDGVCIRRSGEDGCWDSPSELMRAVEIDFVLAQYYYEGPREMPHEHL